MNTRYVIRCVAKDGYGYVLTDNNGHHLSEKFFICGAFDDKVAHNKAVNMFISNHPEIYGGCRIEVETIASEIIR